MRTLFYDFDSGSLGIQYLLGALKSSSHDVGLYLDRSCPRRHLSGNRFLTRVLTLSPETVAEDMLAFKPEVVCFSITSMTYAALLPIIQCVKARDPRVVIVCGGVHATLLPESLIERPEIDFAVTGEAEYSLRTLLDALADRGVEGAKSMPPEALPGVWSRYDGAVIDRGLSPIPQDLDALSFPEKELHHQANPSLAGIYATTTSRGCFYACTFCSNRAIREVYEAHHSGYFRTRSVGNVIEELRLAKERYRPKHIELWDDIFGARREWLEEFSERYVREIAIQFGVQMNPLLLNDERLELLARTGCRVLEIGIQSACDSVRSELLGRHERTEQVQHLVRRAEELGIYVEVDFIAQLPRETPEHLDRLIEFVADTHPGQVNLNYLMCLPKTEITAIALQAGAVTQKDLEALVERGAVIPPKIPARNLSVRYRILPAQVFVARRMSASISKRVNRLLEMPIIRNICIALVPMIVSAERIIPAIIDRRAYFYRWQMLFAFRNMLRVLKCKLTGDRVKNFTLPKDGPPPRR